MVLWFPVLYKVYGVLMELPLLILPNKSCRMLMLVSILWKGQLRLGGLRQTSQEHIVIRC